MITQNKVAIVISTSRRPVQKVRAFCRELAGALPHTIYQTRGSASFRQLAHDSFDNGATRLILVDSKNTNPGIIRIIRLEPKNLEEIMRIRIIQNQLRRERGKMSRITKPKAIKFQFRDVNKSVQKLLLESFNPVLGLNEDFPKGLHTCFVKYSQDFHSYYFSILNAENQSISPMIHFNLV